MNNAPREKLLELVARYGRSLIENPRRVEGLLRDYCGGHRREVSVLIMSLEEGVAKDMLSTSAAIPSAVLLARMTQRLCDHLALSEGAARWAVHSWALALEVISKDELQAIEAESREQAAPAVTVATPAITPNRAPHRVAASPGQIIVSAKGDGEHLTINEALKAATPGAKLLVRPGIYNEGIIIDRRVEIVGDGPSEDIVIRSRDSSCIQMRADRAAITGLTLRGRASGGGTGFFAVDVPEGRLLLDNCDITSDTLSSVAVHGQGSEAAITRCRVHDGADSGLYFFDGSSGTVEECDLFRNANVGMAITDRARPTIRRCRIYEGRNAGVVVWNEANAVLESCEVYANRLAGVGVSDSGKLYMRECSLYEGENSGLFVHRGGDVLMKSCSLFGHSEAEVAITTNGNLVARDCKIYQGRSFGVYVREAGQALLERCSIKSNAESGVAIGAGAVAALRGCYVNNNGQVAVKVEAGGALSVEDSDLTENLLGPWDMEEGALVESTRNRER